MRARSLLLAAVLGVPAVTVSAQAHEESATPYRWVVPPSGNSEPRPEVAESLQQLGAPSPASNAQSSDGQIDLALFAGALPPRAGESEARFRLVPLDPAGLPPVPAGSVAEGNAYRIEATYALSSAPLRELSGPAVLSLASPAQATAFLVLTGDTWTVLPSTPLDDPARKGLVARPTALGTFVLTHPPIAEAPPSLTTVAARERSLVLPLLLGGGVLLLVVVVLAVRRRSETASPVPDRG